MRKAIMEVAAFRDQATRRNSLARLGWLARMADTCPCNIPGDTRRTPFDERTASAPDQLQSCKDRDHGNNRLKLVGGNSARQQATKDHSRNATEKKLEKYRGADRAKTPVKGAADDRQHQSEEQVRSHDLRRRHFGIVQQKNRSERSSASGRKSRFHSNRQSQPGKPAMVFPGERRILHAPE